MANEENLSANIDVSVGIDSASIKKAKDDIASLGTAVDLIADKLGSIGKNQRPSSFKGIEDSLEAAFTNAFERAAKAGYRFSIDTRTGSPSLSPVGERGYAAEQKRVRSNRSGGDKYLPIDQLSMSGQDTAAIRKGIVDSLRKMGFTGINDFIVGGLTVAEDELKKLSLTDIFEPGFAGSLKEDLGAWGDILQDEMAKAQAEWLNSEAKKMSTIIGKTFMSDAMANTGQSSDFQISEEIVNVLQNGGGLSKRETGLSADDLKLALQDFVAGPGGTPIISPQTFLVALRDAMTKIPGAGGGPGSRADIAESEKRALQAEIEKELGATFDEIQEAISKSFEDYDYSKDDKNAARRQKRREAAAAALAKKQANVLTDTEQRNQIFEQIAQELKNAGVKEDQLEPMMEELIDDYLRKVFKTIGDSAYLAGEKAISNFMSNYGELQIGDPTGAIDGMQEYSDRNIIGAIANAEPRYGLKQGAFASRGRAYLPNEYNQLINTAWQTNLPGLPQSKPLGLSGANDSIWADGEIPTNALKSILKDIKAQQKESEAQTKALIKNTAKVEAAAAPAVAKADGAGQAVVEAVSNSAVEALRGAYNSPEFQKIKNLIGSELFDKIFVFVGESLKQNAGNFTAAWDTEFAQQLKGKANTILESSLVLKNALGQFLDLQTFMHRPAYLAEGGMGLAGMNQGMYVQGAGADSSITSVADFNKRAKMLGIPESELGDLKNAEQNKAELDKKITALLGLINLLDQLRIPLSGSNIMGADFKQLQNTVDFMASQGSHARLTGSLTNIVDNVGIIRSMQGSANVTDPGVMFANANKGGLGQGKLLEKLFTDFKEATAPYADMVKFGEKGFTIKINGQELPAHTAQADAIASIIVTEVMRQVSPRFRNLMDDPGYNWLAPNSVYSAQTMPYASPSKTRTKGKPATFDTQQRSLEAQILVEQTRAADQQGSPAGQAAMADARLTHVLELYKAIQSIIQGTATDFQKADKQVQGMLKTLFAQTEARRDVLAGQPVRTEAETAELGKANRLLELRKTLLEDIENKGGNILSSSKTLYKINRELVDDYTTALAKVEAEAAARSKESKTLDKMHATLSTMLGQKNLPVAISTVGYSGSKATDLPIGSTQMANPFNQQAGSVFGKQIQAQMKEYVAAEKKVESANKNMINTWVTARYALYDVGNAFQNVSNRMFMLSRQIFNITDAYRSFETAFMPVERAMGLLNDETQGMLDQFIKLSQVIPSTVEELSRIATLGAQMGIGASGIVKFTETVSQFASITGMSVDTIAEKFGRIAQLTKLDADEMSNLGSAIAYAGVNAVATEPQIMSLAEGIAAVSERVGLLPAQVIGMSTSLASLGVPAEQARGVFTRLFGKIDRAVGKGGSDLKEFAKIAGVSADEFRSKWGEAGKSYDVIRGVLEGINTSGKNLTNVFDTLGIVESREINTLTRLAKNLDVVDSSMRDATKAFASNIFLQQAFGKSSETVDAKIKLFQNSVQSFGAEVGKNLSESFKAVLENLTGLMNGLKVLSANPFMQFLATLSTGVVAFGGVGAGMVAVMSKITAQIYAFRVAMVNTANDPTAVAGFGKQLRALLNYKTELIEMRDELQSPNADARGQIQPIAYGLNTGRDAGDKANYLQKESNIYRANGEELLKYDNIGKKANVTAAQRLTYARMEADSINQIVRARRFEIEALDLEISKKVQAGAISAQDATAVMNEAKARQIHVVAINGEIRALTQEEVLNARGYSSSGVITKAKYQEAAARMANSRAIDIETKAGAVGPAGVLGGLGSKILGWASWAGIAISVATAIGGITTAIIAANEAANKFDLLESGGGLASLRDAIYKDTEAYHETGKAIGLATVKYDEYSAELTTTSMAVQEATGTTVEMNSQTADLTTEVKNQTLALGDNAKAWIANSLASNSKVKEMFDQYPNIIKDLKTQGIDFSNVISQMMNPKIKNPLASLDALIAKTKTAATAAYRDNVSKDPNNVYGYAIMPQGQQKILEDRLEQLQKIRGVLSGVGTALDSAVNQSVFQDIINNILGIGEATEETEDALSKSVKTTRDWASEMAGIFSEAFQNRFGKMQALDNINKQFMDMKDEIVAAKKAIDDVRISIQELTADRGTLQAQLDVAVRYGDTVRADQLRAQIAQKDGEIADANAQIAQQQAKLNKTLVGNTAEAIANRAQVLALVQSYSPYIEEILATTKNSTLAKKKIATLKQQATDRLLSLGFSASEITEGEFTQAFDDMLNIVINKPRDITLKLVDQPAIDAIRSFVAKANGDLSKIKSAITIDVKTKKANGGKPYATGGFVSGSGSSTSDSIPAMLSNGEYVIKASSVSRYGLDFMNSLNQQRVGYTQAPSQVASSSAGDSQMVYLSPEDRALLRSAIDRPVNLYTENTKIAQSANAGNILLAQRGRN